MGDIISYSTSIIADSITNPQVDSSSARDNISPFSFLEFITITRVDYSPEEYNNFYINYLKNWSEAKNKISNNRVAFVDAYINFLKEIVITYSTRQEQKFLSGLDFTNSADLDIAIPFFTDKIRQIVLFYKDKRTDLKFVVDKNKQKGTAKSIEKIIFDKIYEYAFASQDRPSAAAIGISLSSIKSNLKISLEEYVDVYGNYFDIPPTLTSPVSINNISQGLPNRDGAILNTSELGNLFDFYNKNETPGAIQPSVRFSGDGIKFTSNGSNVPGVGVDNNILLNINTDTTGTGGVGAGGQGAGGVGAGSASAVGQGAAGSASAVGQGAAGSAGAVGSSVIGGTGGLVLGGVGIGANTDVITSEFIPDPFVRADTYTSNINPIDPKLYFPDSTYAEVFGSAAFLQDLPLLVNVNLQYDPVCDPTNPIDLIRQDQELRDGVTSNELAELKRKLISKYMGVDFYYIDTTGASPVSGILFEAEAPWANIPNLQLPNTPTSPAVFQGDQGGVGGFTDADGNVIASNNVGLAGQDLDINNVNTPLYNNESGSLGGDGFSGGLESAGDLANIGGFGGGVGGAGGLGGVGGFGGLGGAGGLGGLGGAGGLGGFGGAGGLGGLNGMQIPGTNTRLKDSLVLLRNIGLFFTPEKTGLFQLQANNFTFTVNPDKLLAQKVYIFPDPSIYGNVSINSQADYPIVYIQDYRPDVKNVSTGVSQGDPLVRTDEQAFTPYYSREQNNEKPVTNDMGEYLNFTDLYNKGYITKIQYDIYGNEYALFKDKFGQTFKGIQTLEGSKIVNNVLNGHVFYDVDEGYNFNYNTASRDGSTIRTGLSTHTINYDGDTTFILSSHPYTLYFREFLPYQNLIQDARNVVGSFKDGGRFTFVDSSVLPDPIPADEDIYPGQENYFYANLAEAGLARLDPAERPTHIDIDTEQGYLQQLLTEFNIALQTNQTNADFTIDVKYILSARNVEQYDCGYFTDDLSLKNNYDYGDDFSFYDIISETSKTTLSPLSASSDYKTQNVKSSLAGQLYVKNQAYSLSLPLSSALKPILNKYSQNVKSEIYNSPKDFDIIYDTVAIESENYLIFDKIVHEDGSFISPGTKNTVFKLLSNSYVNRFSNRFFNETTKTVTFCIVSPFVYNTNYIINTTSENGEMLTEIEIPIYTELGDSILARGEYDGNELESAQNTDVFIGNVGEIYLSGGNNKALIPTIYEYSIKDNTYRKLFPLNAYTQNLSSLFALQPVATDDCNFSIVGLRKPLITYNSLNDRFKISFNGVDNNNLFHIFDYSFFINNNGEVEFDTGRYYKHNKSVRTTDFYSTSTLASLFAVNGTYTINNGKLTL